MRLIATVGVSKGGNSHVYALDNKKYETEFSFLALAKAYNIKDIVLIGTDKSKEALSEVLKSHPEIEMVTVESSNVEDVFLKSLSYITKDTILDLTQGYRHYPMLTLLSAVFLQSDKTKNIKDIYYAQIVDEECKPYADSCSYSFVSLLKYIDIANMARIVNTFMQTLIVTDYPIYDKEFRYLKSSLEQLSTELFSNNFKACKQQTEKIIQHIEMMIKDDKLGFIDIHLTSLLGQIKEIDKFNHKKESWTLFNFSKFFLEKDIYLHSLTFLYESMVAFLDEKNIQKKCITQKNRNGVEKIADTYKRRNCLKKALKNCKQITNIHKCKEFSKALRNIDMLRNISAHAFTSDTHQKNIKEEIEKTLHLYNQIRAV